MAYVKFQCFGDTMEEALCRAAEMGDKMSSSDIIVTYCGQCKNGRWMVIFTIPAK